jgi:glycosyltransferase involved in cell wall biosynthesis
MHDESQEGQVIRPARVAQVELGRPLPALPAVDERTNALYQRALCLVRLHSQPLGIIALALPPAGLSPEELAGLVWQELHQDIDDHLQRDNLDAVEALTAAGLPTPKAPPCLAKRAEVLADAPFVSVIVGTRNRTEQLRRCIDALIALRYPRYEVLIVDNAPDSDATARLVHEEYASEPRLRYLREDLPGISWARNRGLLHARGAIVACTDDDVVVDPDWLVEMVKGFSAAEDVKCVTGLVLPLELETPAQYWFEGISGLHWLRGNQEGADWIQTKEIKQFWLRERIIDDSKRHVHLYRVGLFGCGSSMAFQADFLKSIGGFDPVMGSDGPSRCGEDIAAFFQVIMRGHRLVFGPSAIVFHQHRRDFAALQRQIYTYGIGLTAYVTKGICDFPQLLVDLMLKVPFNLVRFLADRYSTAGAKTMRYPRELSRAQLRGMIYGPLAYFQTRRKLRRVLRPASARLKAAVGHPACEEERLPDNLESSLSFSDN